MDFSFNEEQRALQDTVQRYMARDYGFEKRRAILAAEPGWSREVWGQLADLGVLAVNIPEAHGGLGYGPVETMLVMNALGNGMLIEPYLASAVISTALINGLADDATKETLLPQLAAGQKIAVLAHQEPGSRATPDKLHSRADATGDGYVLNGAKAVVAGADCADWLLVSAVSGAGGTGLFLIERGTPGLLVQGYPTLSGERAGEVLLRNVYVAASARLGGEAGAAIAQALDIGLAALCADAVGAMLGLLDATIEYLKTRRQFGQPIGRFQALQHRAADMLLNFEQAKSMSYLAALRCSDEDVGERQRYLSAAKVCIGQACRHLSQNAVQLHGGMGMSDELNVSHWFKRLTMIESSMGDSDSHLQRFIAAGARTSA